MKYLDDRQSVQRSALSISIGSSANTTLDVLFATIDAEMVNLASPQTLTNKTLGFLQTNVITDSATTGSAATLPSGDTAVGVVRLTNASLVSVSGITAGLSGQTIEVENLTGSAISVNNDDVGASVGNRIYTGTGASITMPTNATFNFVYDFTIGYWMLTGIASAAPAKFAPTVQTFTSGTGTYTTPTSPAPIYISFQMVGGGGGGGGASGGSGGGSGGNSTFGLSTCDGGSGGGNSIPGNSGGQGGSATLGLGAVGTAIAGGGGGSGAQPTSAANSNGGIGGSSALGGAGYGGGYDSTGGSAATNSGSGGGGGGYLVSGQATGSGGGSGGWIDAIITSPASTYSYSVGDSGTGSTGGTLGGGTGGSGFIIVKEYYQ